MHYKFDKLESTLLVYTQKRERQHAEQENLSPASAESAVPTMESLERKLTELLLKSFRFVRLGLVSSSSHLRL